jgi:hypothetical protein
MKKEILLSFCLIALLSIISCFGPNLPAPTNVYATQGTYNDKIVITWENNCEDMLEICRRDNNNVWSSYYTGGTEYIDYDIELNVIYYYIIRAMLGEYAGDFCPPVSGWAGTIGAKQD